MGDDSSNLTEVPNGQKLISVNSKDINIAKLSENDKRSVTKRSGVSLGERSKISIGEKKKSDGAAKKEDESDEYSDIPDEDKEPVSSADNINQCGSAAYTTKQEEAEARIEKEQE